MSDADGTIRASTTCGISVTNCLACTTHAIGMSAVGLEHGAPDERAGAISSEPPRQTAATRPPRTPSMKRWRRVALGAGVLDRR